MSSALFKLSRLVFTNKTAVTHNRNTVTDLIDLIQKVGDKDDGHALLFQLAQHLK